MSAGAADPLRTWRTNVWSDHSVAQFTSPPEGVISLWSSAIVDREDSSACRLSLMVFSSPPGCTCETTSKFRNDRQEEHGQNLFRVCHSLGGEECHGCRDHGRGKTSYEIVVLAHGRSHRASKGATAHRGTNHDACGVEHVVCPARPDGTVLDDGGAVAFEHSRVARGARREPGAARNGVRRFASARCGRECRRAECQRRQESA